jgi:AraC family transcriptional regulator
VISGLQIHWSGIVTLRPWESIGPRIEDAHVLVWMDEGRSTVVMNGEPIEIGPGQLVLCPPGAEMEYRWGLEAVRLGYVFFTAAEAPWATIHRMGPDDVLPVLLRHLLWLQLERREGWRDAVHTVLQYVLELLVTGARGLRVVQPPPLSDLLRRTLTAIGDRWRDGESSPIALAELAGAVGVSEGHLSREFRREVGLPPHRALLTLRLHRAAALLADPDLRVVDVAHRCGFANEFHFSIAFKRYTGTAPALWRRAQATSPQLPATLDEIAAFLFGRDVAVEYG